ncbi:MAG TPA: hypothetical protein VH575_23345 [Gemmataceae bacterium]|jgi:hypothetical protein
MKRRGLLLATIGMMLLTGGVLQWTGWLSRSGGETGSARIGRAKSADPLATPAGWRYRQSRPHHWRYIMLRN